MSRREIIFKALSWSYKEDEEEGQLYIYVGGLTKDEKSVQCTIINFKPFVYLELPTRITWRKGNCKEVFLYFQKYFAPNGPLDFSMEQKYSLYQKKLTNTLKMTFPTHRASQNFASRCRSAKSGFHIPEVGDIKPGEFLVDESNIDPILKYTALRELKLAGYIKAIETIRDEDEGMEAEERKYSSADIDFYADWADLSDYILPPGEVWTCKPKDLCFDLECTSVNHNSKIPDPKIKGNYIFQIGNIVKRGDKILRNVLLTLYDPLDIEGLEIIKCKTERDLLLAWINLVATENPDILSGYNILEFDMNYIIERCIICEIEEIKISRLLKEPCEIKKVSWKSSAYGEQEYKYLAPTGTSIVDIIMEIKRNYKLPSNSLNVAGKKFLNESKDDVTPRQLFMLVDMTNKLLPIARKFPKGKISKEERIKFKKQIQYLLPLRRSHGVVKELRTELLKATTGEEFVRLIRKLLTVTGKYCMQDVSLTARLGDKLNIIVTMEEMANIMCVPMSYLHTRGQQIKVVAQIYRNTSHNGFIIPYRGKDEKEEPYEGATVFKAVPGLYKNVFCEDFESLYPSILINFNICYTTYISEGDTSVSDEECHCIKVSSHKKCEHDTRKHKGKIKKGRYNVFRTCLSFS